MTDNIFKAGNERQGEETDNKKNEAASGGEKQALEGMKMKEIEEELTERERDTSREKTLLRG